MVWLDCSDTRQLVHRLHHPKVIEMTLYIESRHQRVPGTGVEIVPALVQASRTCSVAYSYIHVANL